MTVAANVSQVYATRSRADGRSDGSQRWTDRGSRPLRDLSRPIKSILPPPSIGRPAPLARPSISPRFLIRGRLISTPPLGRAVRRVVRTLPGSAPLSEAIGGCPGLPEGVGGARRM